MFLEIPDLLTPAEVEKLRAIAKATPFVDGKISNPHNKTKDNQQIEHTATGYRESAALLSAAYNRSDMFREFVFPKFVAPPMMCRYGPGQAYGSHSDAGYETVQGRRMRFDVSSTVFLSDPEGCDGGELTIHLGSTPVKIKGKAGSAIVYPSSTIHEVAPIKTGERLVAITFIESQIRDPAKRDLVYLLNEVYALEGERMEWNNRILLQHVQSSLLRMWAE